MNAKNQQKICQPHIFLTSKLKPEHLQTQILEPGETTKVSLMHSNGKIVWTKDTTCYL